MLREKIRRLQEKFQVSFNYRLGIVESNCNKLKLAKSLYFVKTRVFFSCFYLTADLQSKQSFNKVVTQHKKCLEILAA